jgi:predicted benzoate:H+ symporter BenE
MEKNKNLLQKLTIELYLKILAGFYACIFHIRAYAAYYFWPTAAVEHASVQAAQSWIVFLLVFDLLTTVFLLLRPRLGVVFFHITALTQIFAYITFSAFTGRQDVFLVFHVVSLVLYWKLVAREKRKKLEEQGLKEPRPGKSVY